LKKCLFIPFAPYITEALWFRLGNKFSIHTKNWPKYDESLIKDELKEIVVQINGKKKGVIFAPLNAKKEVIEKMALELKNVKESIKSKDIKRVIYVEGRIINFVI